MIYNLILGQIFYFNIFQTKRTNLTPDTVYLYGKWKIPQIKVIFAAQQNYSKNIWHYSE